MLANILKLGAVSLTVGGYLWLSKHRVPITHPLLSAAFQQLHQKRPQYTLPFFKALLKLRILKRDERLQWYWLGGGFDSEGEYIEEIEEMGFLGMEVGPTCLHASLQEEGETSLGLMKALANICTYQERKQQNNAFKVQLCVAPNFQILKYTPYLLRENLMGALNNFFKVQMHHKKSLVDQINFTFYRKDYALEDSKQVDRLKLETRQQGQKLMDQFNKQRIGKVLLSWQARSGSNCIDWPRLLHYIIHQQSL